MSFTFLKRYMPRSLFGRAVMILLVPIIALQLIVAAGFIQRHFDGVTRQLASGVASEIDGIIAIIGDNPAIPDNAVHLAQATQLEVSLDPFRDIQPSFARPWFDVSGRTIHAVLQSRLGRDMAIDLSENPRVVKIAIELDDKILNVTAPRRRMSASNPHQLLVIMMASAILLTVISLLFLRNQVKPIVRLARAAEDFGKGRSTVYKPSGADEVRRAGVEFLSMRQRIERHLEQRTLMLSGVSHDLRTPLTRMRLELATADSPEDLDNLAADITEMEAMLDGFLAFARDTSMEHTEHVDPIQFVRDIVEKTPNSGQNLRFDMPKYAREEPLALRKGSMRRALQNLINNGLRYGDEVVVSVRSSPRTFTFEVADNGPGIASKDRERALKPFVRLDPSRNQDKGSGTGLGLAIALDVARTHGGMLSLEDSPELGGLSATITIPK